MDNNKQPSVVIYSTPTCKYCNVAKEFFKKHEIVFEERDVTTNPEWKREMVTASGQLGVPVIAIGNHFITGFNEARLMDKLGIKEEIPIE